MKQRRTSLKDLADKLGVSIATVSRALRNSHEVGEEMTQKVKKLAKELNYRPNPFAQSLRKEAPRVIGVIVPNLVTHYYAAVLDGIEDYASKLGYSVISSNSHEDHEREAQALDNFLNMHVEGIIACLAQDTTDYSHFEQLHKMGVPLVFFARCCLEDMFSQVVGNGDVAAQEATQHMIETGSRRVAFIGGPNHLDMVRRRKHGYLEALRENRIPIDRDLVVCDKIDFDVARNATLRLLEGENPPDAILAFNDIITYAAFDAIKSKGLRIPEDVAIIGFTDGDTAAFVTPRLTAIMDQAHVQGTKACQLLMKSINEIEFEEHFVLLFLHLPEMRIGKHFRLSQQRIGGNILSYPKLWRSWSKLMLTIFPWLVHSCFRRYGITRLFYLFRHGKIVIWRFFLVNNSRINILRSRSAIELSHLRIILIPCLSPYPRNSKPYQQGEGCSQTKR